MKKNQKPVLVKQAHFARIAKCNRSIICRAIQNGLLVEEVGGMVDVNHRASKSFLFERGIGVKLNPQPEKKFKFDPDLSNVWILYDDGKKFRPVMALEFVDDKDTPVREVFFPHEEIVSFKKEGGAITEIEIGHSEEKKTYKAMYTTFDRVLEQVNNPA